MADRGRAGAAALALLAALTAPALAANAPKPAVPRADPKGDVAAGIDLLSATLGQDGQDLVLTVKASSAVSPAGLSAKKPRTLCLDVQPRLQTAPTGRVCFDPVRAQRKPSLSFIALDAAGVPGEARALAGTVTQPNAKTLVARFLPADAGLKAGIFQWALSATWGADPACGAAPCVDRLPDAGLAATRVREVKVIGCRSRGGFYTNGPRNRKVVALTFDDGPWPDTKAFVKVLERKKVPGTFFLIGEQIRGHEALLKRELAEGDMIGNHTYTHANVSGAGGSAAHQLTSTTKAIQRATGGFTPCLFRPPSGASSGGLVSLARGMGMATIEWDVDPTDYSRPGADAIYQRLVGGARNGSILLMHDGGGPRGQTLAALPRVIDTLRSRGYQFQTVTDLLGFAPVYG